MTERFFQSLQQRDGVAACAQLSQDTRTQLTGEKHAPCPRAVLSFGLGRAAVTRVQVYITNAKVDLASGASVFLDQGPSGWRLSAVGCRPQAGKPADEPYDCEIEA